MKRLMCLSCLLIFVVIMFGSVAFAANPNGQLSTTWGEIKGASTIKLAPSATQTRPIEEFVMAQGKYVPPWYVFWTAPAINRAAVVDWAGLDNKWIINKGGASLGTEMDGTITEKPLKDGRAEVKVVLHTKNALTFVVTGLLSAPDFDPNTATVLFGHRKLDVLTGEDPALGESLLKLTFINTAPGAKMPDLIQLWWYAEEGQEVKSCSFNSHSDGTLREAFGVPDGTPGKAMVVQTGVPVKTPNPKSKVADGYPVENINLNVTGN